MPDDVIKHYHFTYLATPDGCVYCKIQMGMYGLPQAGIIAQQLLEKQLRQHGYHQSKTTPSLWQHDTQPISFTPVVDNFGGKIRGGRECTAPTQHRVTVLQMLVQLGRQTILWPHHQVGLQQIKSSPIDAQLRQQSPCLIPAHSPTQTAGPTISPCQAHIWGKEAILTGRRQFPRLRQGRKEIHPRGMQSISIPSMSSQQRTAPSAKLTCLPRGKPNRENDGAIYTFLGLHGNTKGCNTNVPCRRHGPSNPQQCIILIRTKILQSRGRTHVHG
jgi:hypothetical protein